MGLGFYGGICAWALARAHARSGDSVAISAYLGTSDTFDGAVADFAETYADQNARDHARLRRGHRGGPRLDDDGLTPRSWPGSPTSPARPDPPGTTAP